MIFQTKRLLIRPLETDDLDAFHGMQSNPNVMKFVEETIQTKNESKINLDYLIKASSQADQLLQVWAVTIKSNNLFIGTCTSIEFKRKVEIGFRLIELHWGKGYGHELVGGLLSYHKQNPNIDQMTAKVHCDNAASIKIVKDCGFNSANSMANNYKLFELDEKKAPSL